MYDSSDCLSKKYNYNSKHNMNMYGEISDSDTYTCGYVNIENMLDKYMKNRTNNKIYIDH